MIYTREGMPGFLRGLTPSLIKNTINAGTYFGLLFYCEETLKAMNCFTHGQVQFMSSGFARSVQTLISNPLVIIKTRLEVVGFSEYNGIMDAGRQIIAKEGVRGMFTGLGISLIRDVPFSGIFYPIYNTSKQFYRFWLVDHNPFSDNKTVNLALVTTCAGTTANIISCTITHPIDLIRTRVYF